MKFGLHRQLLFFPSTSTSTSTSPLLFSSVLYTHTPNLTIFRLPGSQYPVAPTVLSSFRHVFRCRCSLPWVLKLHSIRRPCVSSGISVSYCILTPCTLDLYIYFRAAVGDNIVRPLLHVPATTKLPRIQLQLQLQFQLQWHLPRPSFPLDILAGVEPSTRGEEKQKRTWDSWRGI